MGNRVVWSPEALEDLYSISEYIERDSRFYAQAVATKVLATSRTLKQFPFKGRYIPEVADKNYRECIIYNYRLIYKTEKARTLIVAVIHSRRILQNIE